ncbi:hypothetical protein [Bifidobacterium lemurum]|uniref:hypothetical protein n=1 Tax=Bifidobacterium lemurum TaxID=1603886 RepID=UPI0011603FCF|nr:hypothetical protein [Bifidobacterium lemurum]
MVFLTLWSGLMLGGVPASLNATSTFHSLGANDPGDQYAAQLARRYGARLTPSTREGLSNELESEKRHFADDLAELPAAVAAGVTDWESYQAYLNQAQRSEEGMAVSGYDDEGGDVYRGPVLQAINVGAYSSRVRVEYLTRLVNPLAMYTGADVGASDTEVIEAVKTGALSTLLMTREQPLIGGQSSGSVTWNEQDSSENGNETTSASLPPTMVERVDVLFAQFDTEDCQFGYLPEQARNAAVNTVVALLVGLPIVAMIVIVPVRTRDRRYGIVALQFASRVGRGIVWPQTLALLAAASLVSLAAGLMVLLPMLWVFRDFLAFPMLDATRIFDAGSMLWFDTNLAWFLVLACLLSVLFAVACAMLAAWLVRFVDSLIPMLLRVVPFAAVCVLVGMFGMGIDVFRLDALLNRWVPMPGCEYLACAAALIVASVLWCVTGIRSRTRELVAR